MKKKVELNFGLQLAKARVLSIQLHEGSGQLEYRLSKYSDRCILLNREHLAVLNKTY